MLPFVLFEPSLYQSAFLTPGGRGRWSDSAAAQNDRESQRLAGARSGMKDGESDIRIVVTTSPISLMPHSVVVMSRSVVP